MHHGASNYCPTAGKSGGQFTDCFQCTSSSANGKVACAWCPETSTCLDYCMESGACDNADNQNLCNSKDTCAWCLHTGVTTAHCPREGTKCSDFADCASCTNSASSGSIACGWCTASNSCTDAAGTGDACDPSYDCSDGCYHTGVSNGAHCPPVGEQCSDFNDCQNCTQASLSGSIACGWCADNNKCLDAAGVGELCNSAESCSVFHTGVGTAKCDSSEG